MPGPGTETNVFFFDSRNLFKQHPQNGPYNLSHRSGVPKSKRKGIGFGGLHKLIEEVVN